MSSAAPEPPAPKMAVRLALNKIQLVTASEDEGATAVSPRQSSSTLPADDPGDLEAGPGRDQEAQHGRPGSTSWSLAPPPGGACSRSDSQTAAALEPTMGPEETGTASLSLSGARHQHEPQAPRRGPLQPWGPREPGPGEDSRRVVGMPTLLATAGPARQDPAAARGA